MVNIVFHPAASVAAMLTLALQPNYTSMLAPNTFNVTELLFP